MHRVLILYLPPKDPQASREYFVNTHIPLAAKMPGQRTMRYSFDVAAAEGESPYFGVMEAEFDDAEALGAQRWRHQKARQWWQTSPITPREAPSC